MALTVLHDSSEQIHYDNPAIPIYVRRGELNDFPNLSALCHWHEEVELLMPLKGYLSYNVNGKPVAIREGNAIFVNSRQMHYGFSSDGTDCEYLCIVFRPQLLCANDEIRSRYVLPILSSPHFTHMVLRQSIPSHTPLLGTLRRLDAICREHAVGHEMQAMGCLYSLWQGLYTLAQGSLNEAVSTGADMLIQKQMLEFIRTNYHERITLDAIAASGSVCRTKCCQIFKRYLGRTPNDYLNSFRLEKGMQLLRSTDLSITQIAGECGFSSASYFTEMFTRLKGCSPTQYRRQ